MPAHPMPGKQITRGNVAWILLGVLLTLILLNVYVKNRSPNDPHTPSKQPIIKDNAEITSNLPVISKIQPFALTNQNSAPITHTNLIGTPWLANIIFTRCPTVCPRLTQTLSQLRLKLPAQLNYISLTTDPAFDTPEKLTAFAKANGSNETNWHFLTGPKEVLMKLAVDDLKLVSLPKEIARQENPSDLFVHSSLYILVDSKGQVRAYFEHDATNLVQRIQTALEKLEKE